MRLRLRSILLLGTGVAIGLTASRKLREDDPNVVTGPAEARARSNPALRAVSSGAQKVLDRASIASLDAIRRTRGAIRSRLADQDDAAWN